LIYPILCSFLVTSCARFEPVSFPDYAPEDYPHQLERSSVTFGVGTFSREEVKRYFASDLTKKNIWPVRVLLINKSNRSYLFSKGMIEPQPTTSLVAARKGRRSAGHRLVWGSILIATFFGIPLGIPLVVGGFQALDANSYMESDYQRREITDGTVHSQETLSGIVFFESPNLPNSCKVELMDKKTDQKLSLTVDLSKASREGSRAVKASVREDRGQEKEKAELGQKSSSPELLEPRVPSGTTVRSGSAPISGAVVHEKTR